MANVRETLIAAKALIDTPEKWVSLGERPVLGAVDEVCANTGEGDRDYSATRDALLAVIDGTLVRLSRLSFGQAMDLFDRAIAAHDLIGAGRSLELTRK